MSKSKEYFEKRFADLKKAIAADLKKCEDAQEQIKNAGNKFGPLWEKIVALDRSDVGSKMLQTSAMAAFLVTAALDCAEQGHGPECAIANIEARTIVGTHYICQYATDAELAVTIASEYMAIATMEEKTFRIISGRSGDDTDSSWPLFGDKLDWIN